MRKTIIGLVWLFVLVSGLPACAGFMYSAEPMEARVIDAETKQPLDGVIVVGHWQLERGTPGGSVLAGQLAVVETVTDRQGRFAFPGFGPRLAVTSHLVNEDPELILFKSGYRYLALTNEYSGDVELRTRLVRRSEWNGKTIELKPFRGTREEYAEHIYRLSSDMDSMLDFSRGDEDCNWRKTPRILTALHKMSLQFEAEGIKLKGWRLGQRIFRIEDIPRNSKCGSVEEFFRSYLR